MPRTVLNFIRVHLSGSTMESRHHRNGESPCTNPCCFFCAIKEEDPHLRKSAIATCFREIPLRDDKEHVLALSGLWNVAMTQPDDPEFPSLGIFECAANLIRRGVSDRDWLLRDQNIYIPYYAAHIIGSYTMNKVQLAERAVKSGVVSPLMELLRGKLSWVEKRVAVRALGHLASHESTFDAICLHEAEILQLSMETASTCLGVVYDEFVGVEHSRRLKYHRDLLTRGAGGSELENRKAEEWGSQLQCWSLYILNCFACKETGSLNRICNRDFLKKLAGMWGGLANRSSPAGIGLIRTLCHSRTGRRNVADSKEVIETLCNTSRSSDKWQYMAIDCLLRILRDPDTRYKVINTAVFFLVDLIEIKGPGGGSRTTKLGDDITRTLLQDYNHPNLKSNKGAERKLKEIWDLKVERRKRERAMTEEAGRERRVMVGLMKQEGNRLFWSGDIQVAVLKYTEALKLCPLKTRKERVVLYSNRAQCHLLLRDAESAISDSTRALSLSSEGSPHSKSLWRRSQAYDMKGLAKESLMDCLTFVNGRIKSGDTGGVDIPYYAARMITKQMNATWIFATAGSKDLIDSFIEIHESNGHDCEMTKYTRKRHKGVAGMSTIAEEPLIGIRQRRGEQQRKGHETKKQVLSASSLSVIAPNDTSQNWVRGLSSPVVHCRINQWGHK